MTRSRAGDDAIDERLSRADEAWRSGRQEEALAAYREALAASSENPLILNVLGNRVLAMGDTAAAVEYLRRAAAADPAAAPLWLNLSFALRAHGEMAGELAALDKALEADPYFVIALLHKAQWFERHDRLTEAVRTYRSLLDAAPPFEALAPALRTALEHGKALVAAEDARLAAVIDEELRSPDSRSVRFQHCLDIIAGRRKVYVQQPAGIHFPYLPAIPFFDRALFPWLGQLEAAVPAITAEFEQLARDGISGVPYVRIAAGQPTNQWAALNRSLDWGALFLWKDGVANDELLDRCPATASVLRELPLMDIPGRAPTAMFSVLRPHTHIPPHHGVTNTRAVIHLPLIIPAGCRFRVGSETREWRVGEAWAFDDTIEHEAWNDSDQPRAILLMDAWNPFLSAEECDLLRTTNIILQRFGDAGGAGL